MNTNDEYTLREAVRHYKSQLFQPVSRPYYKFTIFAFVVVALGCLVYWTRMINDDDALRTLVLAMPLAFAFGFFLKPLQFYLFDSNFTFYFGALASALVACIFSGWRYVVVNGD